MSHKYRMISTIIEDRIMDGIYPSNTKIPTEEALMQEFNVSRNTIRKAVALLSRQGYIISVQGSGMFVRDVDHINAINLENFHGLSSNHKKNRIETKILDFQEISADREIAIEMNCEVGTQLYFVNRLRIVDGNRWVVEYSYFNRNLIPYLNREIIESSIYSYIQEGLRQEVGYIDRLIEACSLDDINAELLGLHQGDPALKTTSKAMLKNGEIFDYSIDYHHYKYARFLKLSSPI
ncbi:GntR family transcriptional regulator [Erysipelothrix rhusiopathiae]|uniref:GntR family transcriptional regulator n=1 Tax=Erysipelothrix rhusiopathiae TaxID=1648 RepID=UPI0024816799|nr:GntR family transcriptional regulator [Erysipelothrix rhusiopathiae]